MEIKKQKQVISVFRFPILFLQIFGFMPVCEMFQDDANKMDFFWISFRTIYAILTLFGILFFMGVEIYRSFTCQLNIVEIERSCFLLRSIIASILLFRLARKWKQFVQQCCVLDQNMASYGWPKRLSKKVKIALMSFWIAFIGNYKILCIK